MNVKADPKQPKSNRKPKRKQKGELFRFSLSSFLIFVIVTGVAMGLWLRKREAIRMQWVHARPMLKETTGYHFKIETEPVWLGWSMVGFPEHQRSNIIGVQYQPNDSPSSLSYALQNEDLNKICIGLGKMSHLKTLQLNGTGLTDQHCERLAASRTIQNLELTRNQNLTSDGLSKLASLKSLQEIDLSWNFSTDDRGIQALVNLPNLKMIDATGVDFSWKTALLFQDHEISLTGFDGTDVEINDQTFDDIGRLKATVFSASIDLRKNKRKLKEIVRSLPSLEIISLFCDELPEEEQLFLADADSLSVYAWLNGDRTEAKTSLYGLHQKMSSVADGIKINQNFEQVWLQYQRPERKSQITITFDFDTSNLQALKVKDFTGLNLEAFSKVELELEQNEACRILETALNVESLRVRCIDMEMDEMNARLARLTRLKKLRLHSQPAQPLPRHFFENWNSKKTLTHIHLSGMRFKGQALNALPELKDFEALKRVRVSRKSKNSRFEWVELEKTP